MNTAALHKLANLAMTNSMGHPKTSVCETLRSDDETSRCDLTLPVRRLRRAVPFDQLFVNSGKGSGWMQGCYSEVYNMKCV